MRRIILITQREFASALAQKFQSVAPDLRIEFAWSLEEIVNAVDQQSKYPRIISFGSDIIVPADILNRLTSPAYNFHPGPPAYPGIFPSVFALYDRAAQFGITLHEMAPRIDSGAIVAVDTFSIPKEWDRLQLDTATFNSLQDLLSRTAPQLAHIDEPLPTTSNTWTGALRTRKEFEDLCHLPENTSESEFARRYRAIGEGPEHVLTITRFGRVFRLMNIRNSAVVRGGQPTSALKTP